MLRGRVRSRALAARAVVTRACLAAAWMALPGCAGAGPGGEGIVAQYQAITTTDFEDGTGSIRIRVKTCDWTAMADTSCAYCSVDPGWARIGGGAEIRGEAPGGARLRASFPDEFLYDDQNDNDCTGAAGGEDVDFNSTWVARAAGGPHQLRAYVIGIQMLDHSGTPFKPHVSPAVDRVTSAANPPHRFSSDCPQSHIIAATGDERFVLVGGGAEILDGTGVAYLTESRPFTAQNGENVWRATALGQADLPAGGLKCYGIGIDRCPEPWNGSCLAFPTVRTTTTARALGYGTASLTVPPPLVPTSAGGQALFRGRDQRFLADLIPFNGEDPGFTVRSKSGESANSGATTGASIVIGRPGTAHRFHAIRSDQSGMVPFEPASGLNPLLRQSRIYPVTADAGSSP